MLVPHKGEHGSVTWSLCCVGSCVPQMAENCGHIPQESAKVAWDLNPNTFAFLSFKELELAGEHVYKCVLAEVFLGTPWEMNISLQLTHSQPLCEAMLAPAMVPSNTSGCHQTSLVKKQGIPPHESTALVVVQCFGVRLCCFWNFHDFEGYGHLEKMYSVGLELIWADVV